MSLACRPAKQSTGWAFAWCPTCLRKRRMGKAKCAGCQLFLMHCSCHRGKTRSLLELWA